MPIEHHNYSIPIEPDTVLWRYMSFEKFLDLLEKNALFFCRADKFSDPFEGTIPKREFEFRKKRHIIDAENSGDSKRIEIGCSNESGTQSLHKSFRIGTTVNCWHINNYESNTMWQAYVKNNEGVAIQSSPHHINLALTNTPQKIRASKVRYINFDEDIWYHPSEFPNDGYNLFTPLIHKRIEFEDEREFRLVRIISDITDRRQNEYWENQPNQMGEHIPVDLEALIGKVILHPTAEESTLERVKETLLKFGLDKTVERSILQSERYF
jgi:hypothetical protein